MQAAEETRNNDPPPRRLWLLFCRDPIFGALGRNSRFDPAGQGKSGPMVFGFGGCPLSVRGIQLFWTGIQVGLSVVTVAMQSNRQASGIGLDPKAKFLGASIDVFWCE